MWFIPLMEVWIPHANKVKVKNVIETANPDNIPQMLRYSVIDKIMGVKEIGCFYS
jgi:hypothetical protein